MKKMINFLSILIVFIVMVMMVSCTPTKTIKEDALVEENIPKEETIVEEENYAEEAIVIEEKSETAEMISGFRIRAAEASSLEEANEIEKKIVDELGESVYVEFIVDKYMIYVGDCQDRDEAENLKTNLKLMGFTRRVFIAPKKVYKRQTIKVSTLTHDDGVGGGDGTSMVEKKAVNGYRVQVFAGMNKENAENVRLQIQGNISYKVYIIVADNLYKVQVGDFQARLNAEALLASLQDSFPGCFIQKTLVLANDEVKQVLGKYYVQLGAFASKEGAKSFQATVKEFNYSNSIIFEENEFYKVLIGAYKSREQAEEIKQKLIMIGFDGAWIVEK